MAWQKRAPIQLKLLIDKKRNRVLFAECDKDFVDVLFSFLVLPMGRIIRLSDKESGIGSMDELYKSVERLDSDYFSTKACKKMLLDPQRPSKFQFNTELSKTPCYDRSRFGLVSLVGAKITNRWRTSNNSKGFVKMERRFMVTDDFQVVPAEIDSFKWLLIRQGINDNTGVLVKTVYLGRQEVLKLLHRSLLSKTPLTDVFLPGATNRNTIPPLDSLLKNHQSRIRRRSGNRSPRYRDINAKLWFRKSTETVICVEAKEDFVDFLFSLLTLSLASVIERLNGKSRLGSIDNLYRSAQNLSSENIVYKQSMGMILSPKIERMLLCGNNLLGLVETEDSLLCSINVSACRLCKRYCYRCRVLLSETTPSAGFVKSESCLFVTDSLGVEPQSPISLIPRLDIQFGDLDHIQVRVEKKEAIALLKAALTSKTALNQAFGSLVVYRRN